MLSRISIGWQWLEKTLNDIIDTINENKPLQSASIAIEESPGGTVLRVVDKKDQIKQGGGSSSGDGTQVIRGWYTQKYQDWTYKTLLVVDPATCAQSSIQVIMYQPNTPNPIYQDVYFDSSQLRPNK